jgi:hypothetical protein
MGMNCVRLPTRAWKPVTGRNLCCIGSVYAGRGRTLCAGVMWDSAQNVFATVTPSSISKVIRCHYS